MEPVLLALAIAAGLGLLVGLQRTWSDHEEAGVRTFPLITILGVLCAVLAGDLGGWVVAAGLAALAAMLLLVNLGHSDRAQAGTAGITTEVAALVMFAVGAMLGLGHTVPATVVGGAVVVLLHLKDPLHDFAERMGREDFGALIQLTLIALVILPVLPNRDLGPFQVLNPWEIWLMVVLIVGISMAGYVAFKLFGARGGAVVAGVLGGLISSTATTVSYARRSVAEPTRSAAAALVIMLASVVVFGRVLGEIAVVAPGLFRQTAPPLVAMMVFMAVISVGLLVGAPEGRDHELEDREPPSDLKAAIVFGLLYGAVLLGVAFAREHLGPRGLFIVAAVSGLTDIDASTLSTAQLMKSGGLDPSTGWRVVHVGALANLVFKGGVVMTIGHRRLKGRIALVFGIALAGGGALLLLWPS